MKVSVHCILHQYILRVIIILVVTGINFLCKIAVTVLITSISKLDFARV